MIGARRPMLWLLATVALGACRRDAAIDDVPTVVVERSDFVRTVATEGTLRAVEATPLLAPQDSEGPMKVGWIAADGTRVAEGDVVVRFDAAETERMLADSKADVESAKRQIGKHRVEGAAAKDKRDAAAKLARTEASTAEEFEADDEEYLSRNEIIESTIDVELARAKEAHARNVKAIERSVTSSQVELYDIARSHAAHQVQRADDALALLQVRAPHAGIVVLSRNWRGDPIRAGDTVWKGQKLAELPDATKMEAELYVLEADAGNLGEGLSAELVVEARPDATYTAKITHVDALAQPRHPEVPVHYLGVTAAIEHDDDELSVGARVRATIRVEQPDSIVVPRQAVFEVHGKSTVYRLDDGDFEPVEVQLGASSPGRVVIEQGLSPGDRIALRDPTVAADELLGADEASASAEEDDPRGPAGAP